MEARENGTDGVVAAEAALRGAMLAGDVAALDRLIGDDCLFTDQNGGRLTKAADLEAHRSGLLRVTRMEVLGEPAVRVLGEVAVVAVSLRLEGAYGGGGFAGDFAYTRVWRRGAAGWRVEAAHCCAVG